MLDTRDVVDRSERRLALLGIRYVRVQQGQIELNVERLFIELARQIHPPFRAVDVLVQVQHQVVRNDRVAGCEEGNQAVDQVLLGGRHLVLQVGDILREINLFNGPCVLNRVAIHLIELRVSHGAKRQIESGIENHVEVTLSCQKVVLREAAKLLAVVAGFRVFEATQ